MGIYINNKIIQAKQESKAKEVMDRQAMQTLTKLQLQLKQKDQFINNLVGLVSQLNIKLKQMEGDK